MSARVSLDQDWHVRTEYSGASATVEENVIAAEERGLERICLVDRVRPTSAWVGDFVFEARRAAADASPEVLCGIEVPLFDTHGSLELPAGAALKVDHVFVNDDRLPTPRGPMDAEEARERIAAGELLAARAIEWLVRAAANAALRHEKVVLARPFSLLPRLGIATTVPRLVLVRWLAAELAKASAAVELNERWQSPSPAVISAFRRAGVPVRAGSESQAPAEVGAYRWARWALEQNRGSAAERCLPQ